MSGAILYKMTGSGNDFVFVDGRRSRLEDWPPERIRRVCHRQLSLGADGLVLLEPTPAPGSVRFHFFNNDGGRAALCGNAALCATRLAAWLGLAPGEGMRLETDSGVLETRCVPGSRDRAEIDIGEVGPVTTPAIDREPGELAVGFLTVGVPHVVALVEDVARVDVAGRGAVLRSHPAVGPAGANANFVSPGPEGVWRIRTFERGVEGETLACGTGAVATAAALATWGRASPPISLHTASGSVLTVTGSPRPGSSPPVLAGVRLAGEGRLVFRAVMDAE